jgi:trimethylamine corrinoid protein
MTNDRLLTEQKDTILKGDKERARSLARQALEVGLDPLRCIEEGYGEGIREVGRLWEDGTYFLPELVQGAEAMKAAMEVIQPELKARQQSRKSLGTLVIGTVEGDIHDIGKTLVATFLEANGFKVVDLGNNVPVDRFVTCARQESADIICLSALLTTTMACQGRVVQALEEKGLKDRVAVLVGGAPVTSNYAQKIGADGYGANAVEALSQAMKIMEAR